MVETEIIIILINNNLTQSNLVSNRATSCSDKLSIATSPILKTMEISGSFHRMLLLLKMEGISKTVNNKMFLPKQ